VADQVVSRSEAIAVLAQRDLRSKDEEWRAEELFCLGASDMDANPEWLFLPKKLRDEINSYQSREIREPEHPRYDDALLVSLRGNYVGARNAFLENELTEMGRPAAVEGEVEVLESCPCCGRKTLGERGIYDICRVCWWEDDGQDNANASLALGGPNGDLSLTKARVNFIQHGIFNPARADLRPLQEPREKYELGRQFDVEADGVVVEIGTDWRG
jgi:hypothetical protein